MARVVGTIGLERILWAIIEADVRTLGDWNGPLLGVGHDEMGRDRRKESRDGESGGESELHFDRCAREDSIDFVSVCLFDIQLKWPQTG